MREEKLPEGPGDSAGLDPAKQVATGGWATNGRRQ